MTRMDNEISMRSFPILTRSCLQYKSMRGSFFDGVQIFIYGELAGNYSLRLAIASRSLLRLLVNLSWSLNIIPIYKRSTIAI
ncbi:hypothetical protein JBW_04007 [Pelosinus fermentans JBW45]|uniref:Uncharacterized protein n=1 Tax=Pelosinus fermentans JBW45 TaxID=1192197 RepID=I8U001_9FIRM|nr:hypothetical protein JBW_04007 [Pelosinus fermentans JBW45]